MVRPIAAFLATALLLAALPCVAAQGLRIEPIETDPPAGAELPPREALYVRVRYDARAPFRVQARGYRGGVEQQAAMTNPSPVYAAGQGEAIAWIAFETGLVDEVRVLAFDERWQPVSDARLARPVLWSRSAPHAPARAPWVAALDADQQSRVAQRARAATPPATGAGVVLLQLAALSVPGYLVLQAFAAWRRRGRPKRAELAPLLVTAPAFAHALFALRADANLWPLLLLLICPPACLYLVVVAFVRGAQRPTIFNMDSG